MSTIITTATATYLTIIVISLIIYYFKDEDGVINFLFFPVMLLNPKFIIELIFRVKVNHWKNKGIKVINEMDNPLSFYDEFGFLEMEKRIKKIINKEGGKAQRVGIFESVCEFEKRNGL